MSLGAEVNVALYRGLAAAQDKRLLETPSSLWIESRKYFFESVPGHRKIRLEPGEARHLFLHGAGIVRYACEESDGSPTYEIVCDDKNYGFDSLTPPARRRARRGLNDCAIDSIEFDVLAREGCEINQSVFDRQNRERGSFLTDEGRWRDYVGFCRTIPNIRAFGAMIGGKLCAFAVAGIIDGYCYLLHTHGHSDYLWHGPMNALILTVTREMLANPDVECVSWGVESLLPRPELERFKMSMGYRRRPTGRRILINPMWRPLFYRPLLRLIEPFAGGSAAQRVRDLISLSRTLEDRRTSCVS